MRTVALVAACLAPVLGAQRVDDAARLLPRLVDPATAAAAADEACRLGAAAGPLGVRALADERIVVRRAGTVLLRRLGPAAHDCLPRLVDLLEHAEADHAVRVLWAMADVAPLHDRAANAIRARMHRRVEVLVKTAPRPELADQLRRGFVGVLIRFQHAPLQGERLEQAVDGDHRVLRELAVDVLVAAAPGLDPPAVATLERSLRARLLRGPAGDVAVGPRVQGRAFGGTVLVEDRFYPKVAALLERRQGEPLGHPAVEAWRALYGDRHQRAAAVAELALHPEHAPWTLPVIETTLDDPSAAVVGAAVTSIGVLGRGHVKIPTGIVASLRRLRESADPAVAARAAVALRQLGDPRSR